MSMMYETVLFLTLLINVHSFDEPDEYLDYQEYVGDLTPQEILEGFPEAIPDLTTKNNNLEDFLQEMQQWLQANLLATIVIGVAFLLLPILIVICCCYLKKKDQMILEEVELQQMQWIHDENSSTDVTDVEQ